MANFGVGLVTVTKTWTELKTIVSSKSLLLQYDLDTTNNAYQIFAIDNKILYFTNIYIGTVPEGVNQAQNDIDKSDFENNFQSGSNVVIDKKTADGSSAIIGTGTAGTPASGVMTIQGISGGFPIPISGSITANNASVSTINTAIPGSATFIGGSDGTNLRAVRMASDGTIRIDPTGTTTQPISGTVTANAGTGTFTISGTVTSNIGTTNGLALDATLTGGTQRARITDGTNNVALASTNPTGTEQGLIVRNIPSGTQTISGTVTANAGTGNFNVIGTGTAGTPASGVVTIQGIAGGTAIPVSGSISATNPSVGTNNSAIPTSSTQIGGSDGTNLQASRVFDLDSGAGSQYVLGVNLRLANSGGSVEFGTASNPFRIDTTGTTTQPISAASLPLPTGAATETTLSTRLAETTFTTRINTLGQKAMTASMPVVIASDQSSISVSQATAANLNAQVVGAAANGAAVAGNPVRIGASDGATTRNIASDSSGRLITIGAAANGAAVTGNPVLIGASDGTNARNIASDSSGRLITIGAAAAGSAVTGNPVLLGGSDGTNAQTLRTSNTTPGGTEYALITRNIPSGTQTVSGTVTANAGTGNFNIIGTGSAGTPATGVVTIQGIAGGTPISSTNPSVGTNSTTIPGSSTLIGGNDPVSGNLLPVTMSTDGHIAITHNSMAGYAGQTNVWTSTTHTNPVTDDYGAQYTRGQILTDEGSYTDDFSVGLTTALTGTLDFTNNSNVVTGSGTAFTTQLNYWSLIKKTGDAETLWLQVENVIDDTNLVLSGPYQGTTQSGQTAVVSAWKTTTGAGGSISVASSILTLTSGTTSGSKTGVNMGGEYIPLIGSIKAAVTQRIANQTIFIGYFDNITTPAVTAGFLFDGTTNTTVKCQTSSAVAAADTQTSTITLPGGVNSAASNVYQIVIRQGNVAFLVNGYQVALHTQHVIAPYTDISLGAYVNNAATVTTTNVNIDLAVQENLDRVDVQTWNSNADWMQVMANGRTTTGLSVPLQVSTAGIVTVAGSGNFTVAQATASNLNARVSGATTTADAYANPTTAVTTQALLQGFNGTTWDRLRSSTTNGLVVDVARIQGSGTATLTNVNISATSVTLLASNTNREHLIIVNDSDQDLLVKFGATASLTSFSVKIPRSGGMYESHTPCYTGIVDGIWVATGTGAARMTELT